MKLDIAKAKSELAPTGRLRAAINRGNGVLVQADPVNGEPTGVTVDLARAAAERLGVPVDLISYEAAGKVFEAIKRNEWDIAFLAIEPVRASEIEFTAPYVIIEGIYVVRQTSPISSIDAVDRVGNRISVVQGSAYDLFLSRSIKHATILRSMSGEAAMNSFISDKLEVVAGVRQAIVGLMKGHAGLCVLEPPFMEIRQAMGTRKGGLAGVAFLKSLVEEMKASGAVAASLRRGNQYDAVVAPPASD
jgi:polar amino acid transport system substrate-binding protein